jgi:CBS domain-containing protein
MSLKSILSSKDESIVTVDPTSTVEEAAWTMRQFNIGALVVIQDGRVRGLLTQRDVANGLAEYGTGLALMKVRSIMRSDFVHVSREETTMRVMMLMTRHRATHLPVMDGQKLVGIVSIGDVVKERLGDLELETNVLRDAYIAAH